VRDFMEEWLSHLPAEAQPDMRGALRGDDRQRVGLLGAVSP
jgi:hypothetical protein